MPSSRQSNCNSFGAISDPKIKSRRALNHEFFVDFKEGDLQQSDPDGQIHPSK